MGKGKVKQLWPRTLSEAIEPPGQRRAPRMASEPVSRRNRHEDSWQDGFLRLQRTVNGRSLSYIVDGLGAYYDATAPSELEEMLEKGGWENVDLLERAKLGMAELLRLRVSLDNDPRRKPLADALAAAPRRSKVPPFDATWRCVTVVDQPVRDPTIGFGLAGEARFAAMLSAAREEHPDLECVVVMDPSASFEMRDGHLRRLAEEHGATFIDEPVEAISLIEQSEAIYVVTSHIGFEAAMRGRNVICFGMPYYAGWGFTDDRLDLARRTRVRTPLEVFAASFLVASRYYEPYGGEPCSFEEALAILALSVARDRENAARTLCVGFSAWKRRWALQILSSPGNEPVMAGKAAAQEPLQQYDRVVAWASRAPKAIAKSCADAGIPLLRTEDGFLRSIGLGVALRPGASYVLDGRGIYYDCSGPSDLEYLLENTTFEAELLERAARLRTAIVDARLSKYNVGNAAIPTIPKGRPVVLVAGQVEDDASIRQGGATVSGTAELLRKVREQNPDSVIAFKPHPDVEAGLRAGRLSPQELESLADVILRDVSAPDAIDAADSVHVISSLIGFEALLRGKPVTTHGLPFYAGWGLTESPTCPRRTRRLTLDELIAGALIQYTRYVDPRTGLPCPPEVVVRRLMEGDPNMSRRERTLEATLKHAWSIAFRRLLHRKG